MKTSQPPHEQHPPQERSSTAATPRHGHLTRYWRATPRPIRLAIITTTGGLTIAAGIAMLVLPGPGVATIAVGLLILGTEYTWARRARTHGEHWIRDTWQRLRTKTRRTLTQRTRA